MKISVIITTILVAQVSASFFDVFQGAVLSVQNSFGKLLSDVVTDVKDTVDCTILAVEHVLSLSYDATTRYYDKCGVNNKTDSVTELRQDASVQKVEVTLNLPANSEYLQKVTPAEADTRINETQISKDFGNFKSHDNVLSIENVLAKESEELVGVGVLVKNKLDKLSHEVTSDLKKIEKQMNSGPSVNIILESIDKDLERKEQNTNNTSEASKVDQVLRKLDATESTEATESIKLKEIMKNFEKNSKTTFVGLRHQFEEWKEEESRHLSEIKSKIEEHEKVFDHLGSYNMHGSNSSQPVISNIDMNKDNVEPIQKSQEINTTPVKEILENRTRSKTIGDSNAKPLVSVANKPSSFQNKTWNENGLNATATTSTSYTTTGSSFGSKIIHAFESPTSVGYIDRASFSTNKFTILQNNLTRNNTNETVTNTTLGINSAPANGTIPRVVLIADLDKQESTTVTANEPKAILFTNKNHSNVTVIVSNPLQPLEITVLEDVILPVKIKMNSGKEESSYSATNNDTVITCASKPAETEMTSTSQSNTNSNDTVVSSTANTMVETKFATSSEHVESSNSATNELVTTLATFGDIESNDSLVTSTPASINISTAVNKISILPTVSNMSTVNEESSTVTATLVSEDDNDSNKTMLSSSSPNLESISISETIQPKETTLVSGKCQSTAEVYDTKITNISLPIAENTPVNVTIQPEETGTKTLPDETTTASSNKEFSTVTTLQLTTTSKILYENDSATTKTNTPTPIISTSENVAIQAKDTTTISTSVEESLYSTVNRRSGTPNTVNDDSRTAVVTMTPETISESIAQENVTAAENCETLGSNTNSAIASAATLIDIDSNTDAITSTEFPTAEITTVIEIIDPFKSTTPTDNIEPSVLSTIPVTILDKVTNKNMDSIIENEDSVVVTEMITVENTTASEEKELTSTSATAQSAINEIVTRAAFPPTESIPTSESTTASRNEEDLKNSPTLEASTSSTPENLNSPDLNFMVRSPPLKITESPPVNREWLKPGTLNQQNYNTNGAPRNNYEFNAPISLSDGIPRTRQPHINPKVPLYRQASPPITRGLLNDVPMLSSPDRLIAKVDQQPKIENDALQKAGFDIFSAVHERLSHSNSPFGPEEDIPKMPLITNARKKHIIPQRMNYENPSYYLPTPKHPIGPPYSFDDRAPANTYRPQGLTTRRPKNYRSPPMGYNSFLNTPRRDSEAHRRALKEARQLIANSKRTDRIMNSIMKNRNKFNARSVFG